MRPLGLSAQGLLTWELYIIQELCDAGSLLDALQAGGMWSHELQRADMCLVINAAQDIAAGMAYLHRKNILHGDLKPDNVLLRNTAQGTMAKVGDFGLSIKMAGNKTHVSGVRHGTPLYMAPEILRSERAAKAADVYAFGVMVWELLHGRTAWQQLMLMTDPHAPLPDIQSLPHMHLLHWCDTPGVARPITPRCTPLLPSLSPPTLLPQPCPHSPPSFSAAQPPAALPSPSPASGPPGTASVPSAAAIQPGHSQSCPPPAASPAIGCDSSAALGGPPAAPPSCVPGSQPYGPPGQPTPEVCPHSAGTSPALLHTAQPGAAGVRAVPPSPSLALTELACLAAACLEEEPGRRPQFESIQQQLARIVALAFQELASS
ncbi:kinase-like domain-containing protein [Haematococcus lacustris]